MKAVALASTGDEGDGNDVDGAAPSSQRDDEGNVFGGGTWEHKDGVELDGEVRHLVPCTQMKHNRQASHNQGTSTDGNAPAHGRGDGHMHEGSDLAFLWKWITSQ